MDVNASWTLPSWAELASLKLPTSLPTSNSALYWLALIVVASVVAVSPLRKSFQSAEIYPVINKTKEEYLKDGKGLIARGAKEHGGKPFRVYTGQGTMTILAPEFAMEVRNDNRLSSTEFLLAYWQAGTPGFEPYFSSSSALIRKMVKSHLTQANISKLSGQLSEEASDALRDVFTDNEEWHEITLAQTIPQIVARVSALVFLGPELCRDPRWLNITMTYPSKAMAAAKVLRSYPSPIRRLVHWFLPCCRELRQMLRTACQAIEPIQQRRREQEAEGVVFSNALAWIEKLAKKQQDRTAQNAAYQQLGLSILANASSTDLVSQNILDLCFNEELVEPLRGEVMKVAAEGWKSSALYNLRLMDSVLKETLRLKPIATGKSSCYDVASEEQMLTAWIVALGRRVMEDNVKLSDGSVLPRTTGVAVSSANMWDPVSTSPSQLHIPDSKRSDLQEIYPNPDKFDGYRFLRMREAGNNEHIAQLASVSPEHLGFGLGAHACPGRFFGASTTKLVMAHFLLKYEFKLPNDDMTAVDPMRFGFSTLVNPRAKIVIRRRKDVA
ncbi:cytochrome p450 monooxygenase [Colletotrichum kahawae]|uniref:Cytochrome p450 monooxygenase n=1 Tax=Colletotrichum kahawae TaxID=34407 RepID=A0AAD9YRX9_COLKA|nr:cytochrome p450 monooxygenase [Colletotrichum kahawae]